MRYALLVYSDQSAWEEISEEEAARLRAESMPRWVRLFEEMGKADPAVVGRELVGASEAKVVRVVDGETIVTDGPFAETKEQLGGIFLTELPDLDEAIRLARRATEIREFDAAWNTLGVALYYDGDLEGALEALRRSVRLQGSGNVVDWLFLAMAHQGLGNSGEARVWYERAVDWMRGQSGVDPETARFRAEAEAVFAK